MEDGIIRTPTESEKKDFIPIVNPSRREKTEIEKFNEELGKKMQICISNGVPFCDKAARDDFKDYWEDEVKKNVRKNGYLKPEEIKPFKINWTKYSDLNNFEIIDEKEVSDEYETKKHPGLDIKFKTTIYKFKGYSNTYSVMEDKPSAIRRAREKLKELEEVTKKK
jgi:hypothetical protein